MLLSTAPALKASIGPIGGVTIGPHGVLYIAASNVLSLQSGKLHWVVGRFPASLACGSYCSPASQPDFAFPTSLAFDSRGDLFVASHDTHSLYELASTGIRTYIGNFVSHPGSPGRLATGPGGGIVEAARRGVFERAPDGSTTLLASFAGLSAALGGRKGFIAGDGLAVSPKGTVYVDTNSGDGFSAVSAILAVTSTGTVESIWSSAHM